MCAREVADIGGAVQMREQGSRADVIARRLGVVTRDTGDRAMSQLYEKGQLGLPSWAVRAGGRLPVSAAVGPAGQQASAARYPEIGRASCRERV